MPVTVFKQVANNIAGTLLAAIDISQTALTLSIGQGAQFPSVFPFYCSIDYEVLRCTNRVGDVLTVARGQDQTQATIHNIGSLVEIREVAALWRESYTAINVLEALVDALILGGGTSNPLVNWHFTGPTIDSGDLIIVTPSSRIRAGATSLAIRNNANTFDNLIVLDNGNTTVRGTLTATGGFIGITPTLFSSISILDGIMSMRNFT